MRPLFLSLALVCLAAAIEPPRFDTSTVTPNRSGDRRLSFRVDYKPEPVRLSMTNVTLKFCLQQAYSLNQHQVFGPSWIASRHYDITSVLPSGAPMDQVWPALQSLLLDRFKLSLQRESKLMRVYALVPATGGPKLQPARDRQARAEDPVSNQPSRASFNLKNATVKQLCDALSRRLDRPVVDETEIAGA